MKSYEATLFELTETFYDADHVTEGKQHLRDRLKSARLAMRMGSTVTELLVVKSMLWSTIR